MNGLYDSDPTRDLLLKHYDTEVEITIRLPKNAVLSPNAAQKPTVRDHHIAEIAAHGRIAWQKISGYNQRSRGETLMGRWKAIVGPKIKARAFEIRIPRPRLASASCIG